MLMCATNNVLTLSLIKEHFQDMADFKGPKLYLEIPINPQLHENIPIYHDQDRDRQLGKMAFLRYKPNETVEGDLGKVENWDVFATDLLTGCLFCAYKVGDTIMVLHSNLCPQEGAELQQDRFKITIQDDNVTIIKDPNGRYQMQETIVSQKSIEDILCCCYPVTTTIMEGYAPCDRFVGYHINEILQEGYCSVFATKGPEFYAIVKNAKTPEEPAKFIHIPDKRQTGCELI